MSYGFPGNVRELKNIVIRLTTKYAGYTVGTAELEAEFAPASDAARVDPVARARAELASGKPFSLDAALKPVTAGGTYLDPEAAKEAAAAVANQGR